MRVDPRVFVTLYPQDIAKISTAPENVSRSDLAVPELSPNDLTSAARRSLGVCHAARGKIGTSRKQCPFVSPTPFDVVVVGCECYRARYCL
jgi:hypothetical protein